MGKSVTLKHLIGVLKPDQTVFATYRYSPLRLDSIVLTRDGSVEWRRGEPRRLGEGARARLEKILGAGHLTELDRPRETARKILDFLA